jgi:predicted O-linked N-acetylglucosamine transferase (SPINDLY family)
VDCAGHTHGNRLLALARRPSPVQATMILGHGGTTGLAAIDYMLSDGAITPEGMASHFSEKVVRHNGRGGRRPARHPKSAARDR